MGVACPAGVTDDLSREARERLAEFGRHKTPSLRPVSRGRKLMSCFSVQGLTADGAWPEEGECAFFYLAATAWEGEEEAKPRRKQGGRRNIRCGISMGV